jgi:hypothetical protein
MRLCNRSDPHRGLGRRGFLAAVAALWVGLGIFPLAARGRTQKLLSLYEADFYRPHDLAG